MIKDQRKLSFDSSMSLDLIPSIVVVWMNHGASNLLRLCMQQIERPKGCAKHCRKLAKNAHQSSKPNLAATPREALASIKSLSRVQVRFASSESDSVWVRAHAFSRR